MSVTPQRLATIEGWELLDLLTGLVEKSLVVYEEDEQGGGRFRLLETVRQYSRDRLLESKEGERVRSRHAGFFLGFAEEAEPKLRGLQQKEWLSRLEREHGNCRAALEWSQRADESVEAALRLAAALSPFWQMRGYCREGTEWLETVLRAGDAAGEPSPAGIAAWRGKALTGAGWIAVTQGDFTAAGHYLEEGFARALKAGDPWAIVNARVGLAYARVHQGKIEEGRFQAAESLVSSRELEDRWTTALSHYVLGLTFLLENDTRTARDHLREAEAGFRAVGERWLLGFSLLHLAFFAYLLGDPAHLSSRLDEAQMIFQELGATLGLAWVAWQQGAFREDEGDHAAARPLYEESLRLFQELGEVRGRAFALDRLGHVAQAAGEYEHARDCYRQSLALFRNARNWSGIGRALAGLAGLALSEGEPVRAARLFSAAEAVPLSTELPWAGSFRTEYERSVGATRDTLGQESFTAAWAEGQAMPLEQAIEYALSGSREDPA